MTARKEGERLRAQLVAACRAVDALLTPVSLVAPPLLDSPDTVHVKGQPVATRYAVLGFTVPQNLAGLPAVAFPGPAVSDRLPCCLQLTAARGRERAELAIAERLERAMTE